MGQWGKGRGHVDRRAVQAALEDTTAPAEVLWRCTAGWMMQYADDDSGGLRSRYVAKEVAEVVKDHWRHQEEVGG
jgi:hypothetical protein